MLRYEGVVQTGYGWADNGIGDLEVTSIWAGIFLYASSGVQGGLSAYELTEGALAEASDQQVYSGSLSNRVGRDLSLVTINGDIRLVLGVDNASGLVGYGVDNSGDITSASEASGLAFDTDTAGSVSLSGGGLAVAHADGNLATYAVQSGGGLTLQDSLSANIIAMTSVTLGGQDILITLGDGDQQLATYTVASGNGALTAADTLPQEDGLGIGAPTALEVFEAFGQSWLIVAGSQSNSLSVLRIDATGELIPADHILDTLYTRFGAVQDVAVVTIADRVFVVAGGGDDGISLFTLAPDGRLIYLDSFADDLQTGLQNVEALAAAVLGDEIQIYAASQEDAGLTQMSVSLDNLGQVSQGTGTLSGTSGDDFMVAGEGATTLSGGAGDDILLAGGSTTSLTGGLGADVFVMQEGSGLTTISDFEVGSDRIDLTDYTMLRNTGQLSVTPTAYGAEVTYRDEVIEVHSAGGGPLGTYDIFGSELTGPDRAFFYETSTSGGDDGDGGSGGGDPAMQGMITIRAGQANSGLENAMLYFTPQGGSMQSISANASGVFNLSLGAGATGQIEIERAHTVGDPLINAVDALEILRMAVGLDPTFGAAEAEHFIAADVNQDGLVTALDVLEVLRYAVGLETQIDPEWVFVDPASDLSGVSRSSVDYETILDITGAGDVLELEVGAILLGNVEPF